MQTKKQTVKQMMKYVFIVFVEKSIVEVYKASVMITTNMKTDTLTFCSKVVMSCSAFESLNSYSLICLLASPRQKLTGICYSK